MKISWSDLENRLAGLLAARGVAHAQAIAWASVWLQACGYPGLQLLHEALNDDVKAQALSRDVLGIDLHNVSCAYIAPDVIAEVRHHGRAFLRNVRHGLFLVPFSVRHNLAIGCPVDPAFPLGGEREKNPYTEKLEAAERDGLEVDEGLLTAIGA